MQLMNREMMMFGEEFDDGVVMRIGQEHMFTVLWKKSQIRILL